MSRAYVRSQQLIWETVRRLGKFTSADVVCEASHTTKMNDSTVRGYLYKLKNGGYISISGCNYKRNFVEHIYELVNDVGSEAPRINRDGTPSLRAQRTENLWRSIRMIKEFDERELTMVASTEQLPVSLMHARNYISTLNRAGYLTVIKKHAITGGRARYRLKPNMNTGPKPPRKRSVKQLFDPNLDQVVWPKNEFDVEESEC